MITGISLLGCWDLQSWHISYSDGRPDSYPFGEQPTGLIFYSEGWMSASISRQGRPRFSAQLSPRQQSDEDLAQAYRSYFHYAGPYVIKRETVYHTVTQSLNPDMVGTVQERQISLHGDDLLLSGVETHAGVTRTHQINWRRAPLTLGGQGEA